MDPFAFGLCLTGIGIFIHALWRGKHLGSTASSVVGEKLIAGLALYIGVALLSSGFKPVNRYASFVLGMPPAIVGGGFLLAALEGAAIWWLLRKRDEVEVSPLVAILYLFMALGSCGHLMLFNALADFSPPTVHRVEIVTQSARRQRDKRPARYVVYFRDWKSPNQKIMLDVTLHQYRRVAVGDTIEVETKPGALGIEWVRSYRFTTRKD